MSYPIPGNEMARLATLADYHILDTEFDCRFDNLVEIASAHFDTPIALVSLVDADRQWFKSKVGLEVRETPRSMAFCNYTIANPATVTVIEDAQRDTRFRDNPLVTGDPHIRFYAGAPILAEDGAALGSVCVIDRVPRAFTDADQAMLTRLAENAQSLLELHRRNALLRDAAHCDPLTGLLNRRGLEKALQHAIAPVLSGETCGVLYLDLDHFKQVNDVHGHEVGDYLLKETARRLQTCVRQGDAVARIGGDEFVILLAHPVNGNVLELVASRVLQNCAVPVKVRDHAIAVGVSIGGAQAPRDAVFANELLRAGDGALFEAKRAGRGQVMIAGGHSGALPGDGTPGAELALAISRDELFLEWQSCHDLKTGAVVGYEALVRWHHPRLGLVAPDNFVPLAEACGLSGRLDAWVLFRACEEAARGPRNVRYSINLSAQWIANGNVLLLVRTALERSGLAPDRLVLEITEGTAIGCAQSARAHMDALRALGIRLALDDFGTGYSSLGYLNQYPFDTLKLDRSFVAALGDDPRGDLLLLGTIHLAELLNIGVIAEGVETAQQAARLAAAGCRLGQGYLWARSCPAPWDQVQAAAKVGQGGGPR